MIKIEPIAPNVVKITPPETFKADDFQQVAPQIDSLIGQQEKIRILFDATHFNGWENMEAFKKHIGFVKNHQHSIERIAVMAGHTWQHWVAGIIKLFVHPEVQVFDKQQETQAQLWIMS